MGFGHRRRSDVVGDGLGHWAFLGEDHPMNVSSRHATTGDLGVLENLYRALEKEMVGLHKMWPTADGLDEPIASSIERALTRA